MILQIKNLNKSYDFPVLTNLNISINSNLVHLTGENGSGKTTLLNILSGKISFESGEIYFNNKEVSTSFLANNTVLINQEINLFFDDTVFDNIKIITDNRYDISLIKKFDFEKELQKKVSELSGGNKKKLMILIAMMIRPSILLLDEYSSYIDNESLEAINELIKEYSKDHLVIYVDHNDSLFGKEISIKGNETIEKFNNKIDSSYEKYKFKFQHKSVGIISLILLLFFITISQICYTLYETNDIDIVSSHLDNKNLWLQFVKDDYNLNYEKYYFYSVYDDETLYISYTNDAFPILIESKKESKNYCYVFSNKKDFYEKNITINDKEYFVKGIIDLNVDAYNSQVFVDCIDCVVIKGTDDIDKSKAEDVGINALNDAGQLLKDEKIYNFYHLPVNPSKRYGNSLMPILIYSDIYMILMIFFYAIKNSKKNKILTSYANSFIKLFLNDYLSMLITVFGVGFISYGLSYYSLYLIYNFLLPNFEVTFMNPYKIVIIEVMFYIILYAIIMYFLSAKKRKSIEREYE